MKRKSISILALAILTISMVLSACTPQEPTAAPEPTEPQTTVDEQPTEEVVATEDTATTGPQRGGHLVLGTRSAVGTWDVHRTSSAYERIYYLAVYNTLVTIDEDGLTVPELALSWETDEGGITFYLRDDVVFHDGTPFNAEAVKFNFERILDPETQARYRAPLLVITSIEVIDEFTVRLNLERPDPSLFFWFAERPGFMVSPTAVEQWGEDFGSHPTGTGPFKVVEWIPEGEVSLVRNEEYWKEGLPYADELTMVPIKDSAVRVANLIAGQVDVIETFEASQVAQLEAVDGVTVLYVPSERYTMIHPNFRREPFSDPLLREAVAWAIDRDTIHEVVFFGQGAPATVNTMLPPTNWAHNPNARGFTRDLDKARAFLEQAGKPDGFSFTMSVQNYAFLLEICELVKAQLAEVGIEMTIAPVEITGWSPMLRGEEHDYDAMLQDTASREPGVQLPFFIGTNSAYPAVGWSDADFDAAVDAGNSSYDLDERKVGLWEAQRILAEVLPAIILHWDPDFHAMGVGVHGLFAYPDGLLRIETVWKEQ